MPLCPIHRPRIGLSFSSQSLSLVELHRMWWPGWRRAKPRRVCEQALPSGLLCPSDRTPNIADLLLLVREVRAVVGHAKAVPVALSLPDQCAQIGLFEFDSLPQRTAEREALIRWRFREELHVPPGDTHVVFRSFSRADQSRTGGASTPKTLVLAISLRRDIVGQYEEVCEEAGLLPVSIGLSSLQLFDLFRVVMPRSDELFFAHRSPDGVTFVALREGTPIFLRTWVLRRVEMNLLDELAGTLQFYEEQWPHSSIGAGAPPQPLFLLGDWMDAEGSSDASDHGMPDPRLLRPTSNLNWGVQLIRLGWLELPLGGKARAAYPASALSALAGAVAG